MSRNGSGTYTPPGASFPAVYDTVIDETKYNAVINDIATALTQSIAVDGQSVITANIPMAGYKFTGLANGSASGDSAAVGQIPNIGLVRWCGTAGGTGNAITLTPATAISAYSAGQMFPFKASAANSGATTINVSGVGAIALQANGVALSGAEIASGLWYMAILDTATTAQLAPLSFSAFMVSAMALTTAAAVRSALGVDVLTSTNNTFTKAQRGAVSTLTDAATVAVDLSLANNFKLTLGGNRTLGSPTNAVAGQSGIIEVYQDGTGSRTLAYNSFWKFAGGTAPVLTTTASARDILSYYIHEGAASGVITAIKDVK